MWRAALAACACSGQATSRRIFPQGHRLGLSQAKPVASSMPQAAKSFVLRGDTHHPADDGFRLVRTFIELGGLDGVRRPGQPEHFPELGRGNALTFQK